MEYMYCLHFTRLYKEKHLSTDQFTLKFIHRCKLSDMTDKSSITKIVQFHLKFKTVKSNLSLKCDELNVTNSPQIKVCLRPNILFFFSGDQKIYLVTSLALLVNFIILVVRTPFLSRCFQLASVVELLVISKAKRCTM